MADSWRRHWFGTSAEFWLNLQKLYELRLAENEKGAEIRDCRNAQHIAHANRSDKFHVVAAEFCDCITQRKSKASASSTTMSTARLPIPNGEDLSLL